MIIVAHDHLTENRDLLAMHRAGITAKVLHVSVDADVWDSPERRLASFHEYTGWTQKALIAMERVKRFVEKYPDKFCIALSSDDITNAHRTGKSAVIFGFEGGKPVEESIELLRAFYRMGLRVMQLTWAYGNNVCDRTDEPKCEGLTKFGRLVVGEMNSLGIMIDPGHCSKKTFYQVMELSRQPVAYLHGVAKSVNPKGADLDDEQIKAIASTGGIIGIHFFSHLLNMEKTATVGDLLKHIDHIANLTGTKHIALGVDYLRMNDNFRNGHGNPESGYLGIIKEYDSYSKLHKLAQVFEKHGYSKNDVERILGSNFLRVFRKVCG